MNRCLNVCGTLNTVYIIYYPQYSLTLLEGLGLEDIPTLCLKSAQTFIPNMLPLQQYVVHPFYALVFVFEVNSFIS